jgi:hypothetical protein
MGYARWRKAKRREAWVKRGKEMQLIALEKYGVVGC